MMRSPIITLLVTAALSGSLAAAQILEAPTEEKEPKVRTAYTGEITELSESSFLIRPWDPKLPRRVTVTATGVTRYLRQVDGKRESLKPGDLVLVVQDPRPEIKVPRKKDESEAEREAREARLKDLREAAERTPGRGRAVLRLWRAPEGLVTPEDEKSAEALLVAARAHFKGPRRGGVKPVKSETPRWVGVVKTVKPLTVLVGPPGEPKEKVFETYDETVWIDHLALKPEELKKGRTVLVQTPIALGADGALQALLIAQCKEPTRGATVERKLILRERGVAGRRSEK